MATTSINGIECRDGRSVAKTLLSSISYGKNKKKTKGGELVTAFGCSLETAYAEILFTQKEYEQNTGRAVDEPCGINPTTGEPKKAPIMYVMYQSFKIGEVDGQTAHEIGVKLAKEYLGGNFQYTVNTHLDKAHIHNHIYFNAVAINAKSKFNNGKYEYKTIRRISDRLCKEYSLSVVVPGQERRSQVYSKCKATSFREVLRSDIDKCLKSAKNYADFTASMEKDYFVVTDGKYLKFKHRANGQERYIRSYSLGEQYSEECLRKSFLAGRVPAKKIELTLSQKLKTRTKLLQNNEISYTQKMKNIKALFFTLGVLKENQISKYSGIKTCIDGITQLNNDVLTTVQNVEDEIKKISSLITAVDIYNQNKAVADEYSKTILRERFYKAHEYELDLFNIARKKLDDNNVSSASIAELIKLKTDTVARLDNVKAQHEKIAQKLDTVYLAKDIIDRMHENNNVLVSKREITGKVLTK